MKELNACPLCRGKDEIDITSPKIYRRVKDETGGGLVEIECRRCHISVKEYGYYIEEAGKINNYRNCFSSVRRKWNKIGFKEA